MAAEYGGYMGRILRINLSTETTEEYPFTDQQRRETLGGKALAYRILAEQLTGNEQPFSEENLLILTTGPLTGTGAPGSSRFEITAISPQSSIPVSSNCGGSFGVFLKKAGYDALILSGQCRHHRWIELTGTAVRFHNADGLWGAGTASCFQQLRQRICGNPFGYLCIGPAGEDLLPSATVISGGRPVGKAGFGAILGWKKLKAITVSGTKAIPLYDPLKTKEEINKWNHHIRQNPITSDPCKISSCPGCAIRCKAKETPSNPTLLDLGLDALDAPDYIPWLEKKSGNIPEFSPVSKEGQRRKSLYQTILQTMGLQDCKSSFEFYQNLAEAVSALGLCLFTVGASVADFSAELPIHTGAEDSSNQISIYPTRLLRYTTGFSVSPEAFVAIGKQSRTQQALLQDSFQRKNTASSGERR